MGRGISAENEHNSVKENSDLEKNSDLEPD